MTFEFWAGLLVGPLAAGALFALGRRRRRPRQTVAAGSEAAPRSRRSSSGNGEVYTFRGRRYVPIEETTIEWDEFTIPRLRKAGILAPQTLADGETPGDLALRLQRQLLESSELRPILGAFLVPEGLGQDKWSPDVAMRTAEDLRLVSDESERAQIHALAATLLIHFFSGGSASSVISLTSSETEAAIGDAPVASVVAGSIVTGSGPSSFDISAQGTSA